MSTFTAQVGPSNASKLSAMSLDGATDPLMEDIGEGTVQINDLDRLRRLDEGEDGRVTEDDDEGLQIWIGGEGYPIFDDVDAAVAEALGLQSNYVEAKHTFDHATDLYAASVARLIDLAGSATAAASSLGITEAELLALVPAAPAGTAGPGISVTAITSGNPG